MFVRKNGLFHLFVILCVCLMICCKKQPNSPEISDYTGNWIGVQPRTDTTGGRGIKFTVEGETVTSLFFSCENPLWNRHRRNLATWLSYCV